MLSTKAPFLARALPSPLAAVFLTLLLAVLALSGCNTMSGFGEDVSAAGRGIDQSSEATQEKMTGKEHTEPPRTTTNPGGGY
ncbi:MAG: entericidin A/B family lipoprotein [Magnetospirillum sp.]|nr:entericidin A/B family lipoprotein [Magnetospirillum sp.]